MLNKSTLIFIVLMLGGTFLVKAQSYYRGELSEWFVSMYTPVSMNSRDRKAIKDYFTNKDHCFSSKVTSNGVLHFEYKASEININNMLNKMDEFGFPVLSYQYGITKNRATLEPINNICFNDKSVNPQQNYFLVTLPGGMSLQVTQPLTIGLRNDNLINRSNLIIGTRMLLLQTDKEINVEIIKELLFKNGLRWTKISQVSDCV